MAVWQASSGQGLPVIVQQEQEVDMGEAVQAIHEPALDWRSITMTAVQRCGLSIKSDLREFALNVDFLETIMVNDLYRDKTYFTDCDGLLKKLESENGKTKEVLTTQQFYMFKLQRLVKILQDKEIKRIEARL